jgi:hypothetical protein
MPHPLPACENDHVARRAHSPVRRATAALLAGLLTLAPALRAAAARAKTQVLQGDAGAQARALFGRAAEQAMAGEDERSDNALAQLVRLSPDRQLPSSDYPPAFLLRLEGVRKRLLAQPRGSLRVLALQGPGETRVLLDERPFMAAPMLIKNLIPGEHFVRAERGGAAWADKVVIIAGAETRVAPQPGVEGPVAALMQDADPGGVIPEVQGAPAPVVELPQPVSEAPAPSRHVAMPGAPVTAAPPSAPPPPADTGLVTAAPKAPLPEPPSRALVIPREPTRDDADVPAAAARPRPAPAPEKRIAALEPDAIKTVHEPPAEKKNHALLWVLAGALLLGGLAAGGYYLYESGQTPTSGTVTATWAH